MKKEIFQFENLNFTVIAKPNTHWVSFEIYRSFGKTNNGETVYEKKRGSHDHTFCIEDAALFAHGDVKWDGCSNWHFDEQDEVMIHECDEKGLEDIGKILAKCWNIASKLCPHWCH